MAGLKQSKRVSWARELHQVRLFLAEDAPSISGLGTQDNLQAKGSWLLHASSIGNDDSSLPPGFEAPHPAYQVRSEISKITLVKWKGPPNMLLDPKWVVVAGEESEEVDVQNQRQVRVLEAIYPRLSSVPPNPSVLPEVQDSFYDDSQTPDIPITAIEDEDPAEQLETAPPSTSAASTHFLQTTAQNLQGMCVRHDLPNLQQSQGHPVQLAAAIPHGDTAPSRILGTPAEADVRAAASAAFTAIMKSNEEGSMIDRDLLIDILSNPSLVEKLVSGYGAQTPLAHMSVPPSQPHVPVPVPVQPRALTAPAQPPLTPLSAGAPQPPLSAFQTSQMYPRASSVPPQAVNPRALSSIQMPPKPLTSGQSVVKDANYFKSLVQQHGGEKQDAPTDMSMHSNYQNNLVAGNAVDVGSFGHKQHNREARPKIPRPCVYFNTPKGCRNGANCSYQHDASLPQPRGSKRIKLDRGNF